MFFRKLGLWELKSRGVILITLLALSGLAAWQLPKLVFDFRPEAMLQFSEEESRYADAFAERFNVPDNVLLVVIEGDTEGAGISEPGLTLLHETSEIAKAAAFSEGVYSVGELPRRDAGGGAMSVLFGGRPARLVEGLPIDADVVKRVRETFDASKLVGGTLISPDASSLMLIVSLKSEYRDLEQLDPALDAFEADLQKHFAERAPPGFNFRLGGLPYIRVETVRNLKTEQLTFWPLVGVAYFFLMLIIFRRLGDAALPLLTVGLATAWIVGLMGALGEEITIINNILPTLILVIGVTNAIHILMRIADHRLAGLDIKASVVASVSDLGVPCFLTSLTSAIGFASLMVASSDVLKDFGWQTSLGIMFAYVGIIVFLPSAKSFFARPPADQGTARRFGQALEGGLDAITNLTVTHPWKVLAGALLVLGLALFASSRVAIDAKVLDAFPEGSSVHSSNQVIEERFGGILPLELELITETPAYFEDSEAMLRVDRLEQAIQGLDGVLNIMSPVDIVAEANSDEKRVEGEPRRFSNAQITTSLVLVRSFQGEVLRQYAVEDFSRIRLAIRVGDMGNRKTLALIESIQALVQEHLEPEKNGIEVKMTGTAYLSAVGLDTFVRDLFFSLATASIIIFIILTLVFRSIRIGFVSILPNALPLALTVGLMPLYGYELNTTTVIVLPIAIGLAVDNSIHFISRFRAEMLESTPRDAIRVAFRGAGKAIVSSNVLLMAGFSLLFLSDFEPTTRVAALTVTTIATALLAAIFVLPALLTLFFREPERVLTKVGPSEQKPR